MASLLQRTCLRPNYSLRRQLFISFGVSAFLTLAVVVVLACTTATTAGQTVKEQSTEVMQEQVIDNLLSSSRFVAEQYTGHMQNLEGVIQIMTEITQDRIVGYPDAGWEDDRNVPFLDMDTNTNKYPLNTPPVPLDWNITGNINPENAFEHVQERSVWIGQAPVMSTASYFMQGTCNPSFTDPDHPAYYENCTAANNNFATGGVVAPSPTNQGLYQKSGDLGALLKPLYEAHEEILRIGLHFSNGGAGAVLTYPGFFIDGRAKPYESIGCDWMREINPYTGMPFANETEIERCHPAGTLVPQREYNPMERAWCRDFALNPEGVVFHGPFLAYDGGIPLVSIGRGIFDRRTGHFLGCASVDIPTKFLDDVLEESRLHNESEMAMVWFNDGQIIADSLRSIEGGNVTTRVTETGIIDSKSFESLKNAVNYEAEWTVESIKDAIARNVVLTEFGLLTAYPLPVPPDVYDPDYRPKYLLIHAIEKSVFSQVDELDDHIEDDALEIIIASICIGICGMLLVLVIVWCVSRVLTRPLAWMERIAWRIVNHTDKRAGETLHVDDENDLPYSEKCTPKTEITALVSEFRTMIQGFSGEGASKVADSAPYELLNELTWHSGFRQLYSRVSNTRTSYRATTTSTHATASNEGSSGPSLDEPLERAVIPVAESEEAKETQTSTKIPKEAHSSAIFPAPLKKNRGENIALCQGTKERAEFQDELKSNTSPAYRSSLFWWIFVAIVIPLLLTNAVICILVSLKVVTIIPSWVNTAQIASYGLERDAIMSVASSKADLARTMLDEYIRDLHLMTRLAGWLYFGGIVRSDSFTQVDEAAEECKHWSNRTCPYYSSERTPCACEWEDPEQEGYCTNYSDSVDTRPLQRRFYACQARDADPDTGERVKAESFPEMDYSANTTLWWDNLTEVPGAEKKSNASGYETTYDRIRVSSAMSIVEMPLYNYATNLGQVKGILGTYIGLDADGMLTGHNGCDYSHARLAHFESDDANRAAEVAPDLCPVRKYGFDVRCRPWFATGKQKYISESLAVYVTPPYKFAIEDEIALSVSSPVANPATKEYIGETLVDFYPSGIRQSLNELEKPVSFIITPDEDVFGGDTVVGPDKKDEWESSAISDLLFPQGEKDSGYKADFEKNDLPTIKNGTKGVVAFDRTGDKGEKETIMLAYEPVYQRILLPLDPSDFSRGVSLSSTHVYIVGIGVKEQDLAKPFNDIEDDVYQDLKRLAVIYVSLVAFVSALFTIFTCKITLKVTRPMTTLLHVVQNINAGKIEDDLQPLEGGSTEVRQVYSSFAKLYKIVRISNIAFFSGNLQWAYHFTSDALKLFRKVDDRKAIGIACNNLGNIFYAWAQYESQSRQPFEADDKVCPAEALAMYDEAIDIGQSEFDDTSQAEVKADYAFQLADRLFNRGLFLLLVQDEEDAPNDARERAYKDIARARELDYDAKDFWLERKLLLKYSDRYFCRMIRRIHGLVDFYDDEGLKALWNVKELVEDADGLLFAAWNESSAPLFDALSRVGRLQQLEGAVIRMELSMGNTLEAGRLSMRMFTEDEYILESSFSIAANALLCLVRDDELGIFTPKAVSSTRADLRKMIRSCKTVSLDIGKNLVFAMELSERWEGDPLLEEVNAHCLRLYDSCCRSEDNMGLVAFTVNGDLTLELGEKSENEGRQRQTLDAATSSTSERACPAFPLAVQMLVDAAASNENDSYIVVLTDGYSWDSESYESIKWQIERLNRERNTAIHVIIVGMDVESDEIIEQCKMVCTVSKSSFYADVTEENIDSTFDTISSLISGDAVSNGCLQGITMERF